MKKIALFLLPFLAILLLPEQTYAYDFMWDDSKYVFQGIGSSVSIQLPIYDKDGRDMWVIDGYVYVKAAGKSEQTLLHYKSEGDISGSAKNNSAKFDTSIGGVLKIKDTSGSWVRLNNTQSTVKIYSSGDNFTAELEWEAPYEWRGMDLEFRVKVHGDQNSWKEWNKEWTKKVSALLAPPAETKPNIMTSMLTNESGRTREVSVIWQIAASKVTSATAYYKANGIDKSATLPAETFGTIYVPSDQLINDLYVKVNYKDNEDHDVTGAESERYDVPVFHQAKHLRTKVLTDGSVQLDWQVDNPNRTDIQTTDFWIIQRNTSGSSNDDNDQWTTVGQQSFIQGQDTYTFTDQALLPAYNDHPVYYRIQRASVADSWGYGSQSGTAKAAVTHQLALPSPLSASATKAQDWGKNNAHKVLLTWNTQFNTVPVDGSTLYLRNLADWEQLCLMVSRGFTAINAVMTADIDISTSELMIGDESHPYQGTFDGQGHTLTVKYNVTNPYCAPFQMLGTGALIKNLHTTGTITTNQQFAAGIASFVKDNSTDVTIRNCWTSVEIKTDVIGDGTHGGLIAIIGENTTVTITDCLFDGSFTGNYSTVNCGGIVGWRSNTGLVNMTRVVFHPAKISISDFFSSTFIRNTTATGSGGYTLNDCYYTKTFGLTQGIGFTGTETELKQKVGWLLQDEKCTPPMGVFHIKTADDWATFATLVNSGNAKDLNAWLHADITLSNNTYVLKKFSGIFDGQGHTVTITLSGTRGLFDSVGNATIKNLHVKGNLNTNIRMSGGIVGMAEGSEYFNLFNCWSSVIITTSAYGDFCMGGLVGGIAKDTKAIVLNCLFDGRLIGSIANDNGGFIGWTSDYGNVSVANGLFNPEMLDTDKTGCMTFVRYNDQLTTGVISNCYYKKTYGRVQGVDGSQLSASELIVLLGNGWKLSSDGRPVPTTVKEQDRTYVWDNNAQMLLYTDKYVNGVLRYTDERVITPSERQAGQILHELQSPCVDYGFRIVTNRNTSKLRIGDKESSVKADTCTIPATQSVPGDFSPFYFDYNVKMDSLKTFKQHSSVQLKWWTNGGNADYYEIHRRDTTTKSPFQLIATDVQQHTYTDHTVKAHHVYEYMVKAVVQCEGIHADSLKAVGKCDNFGRISGFVRMANGTGIGGVTVKAIPDESLNGIGIQRTVTTDATGYFFIDSLAYVPNYGLYTIMVEAAGYTPATCNFSEDKNEFSNTVLALREYYIFSGKVLYEGTSIPVPGAQFRLDGKPLYDYRQNRVETDNQGSFNVSIPKGPHRIQVEKKGHVFENDGYYINPDNKEDSTIHDWQRNKAEVYLWDQTRVTLRGRMVGGDVQGQKPLGQSLSYNNLGRDLKMVMMLEGDNTSWIVRDPQNLSITERHDSLRHGAIDPKTLQPKDITRWDMTRHSITIHPDVTTGEYEVKIFPVKYKVTEMSCTGYTTLFQHGKVGETLDLTNAGKNDTTEFKCVYHSPVKLGVKQLNMDGGDFFGDNFYLAQDIDNEVDTVFIYEPKTKTTPERYVLGHPVFMANASYLFSLQAQEEYAFENRTDTVADIVPLHKGTVYFHNDLVGNNLTDSVQLDSIGRGTYQFIPKNTTFLGNDESSLRTLDINLLYDGVYYDIKPFNNNVLRAYVMGAVPAANGRQTVSKGGTHLIDILRDPPGAGSSAYIESGSKTKYAYTLSMDGKIGLNIERSTGTGTNVYQGLWSGAGGGSVAGTINNAKTTSDWAFNFGLKCGGTWVYSYEMTTTQRIQTSSNHKWVGPKADIYIGMTDNIIVSDAIAVRMVPESQFEKLKLRTNGKIQLNGHKYDIKDGTVQVLATGLDAKGKKVYLISDEVFNYYAEMNSEFMHTGEYIETELIPNLLKMRNERLLPKGTDEKEAQKMANRDKRNVYISLVDTTDPEFGYHASIAKDKKDKYKIIRPTDNTSSVDEVAQYNNEIITWAGFIARNEKEKVQAPYNADLVKHIDFDGAANVQYSESFTTADDYSRYLRFEPFSLSLNGLPDQILSNTLKATEVVPFDKKENGEFEVVVLPGYGSTVKLKFKPVFTLDINDKNSKSESWSKKTGFTLSAANKSNLSVSVYRTKVKRSDIGKDVENGDADVFLKYSDKTLDHVRGGASGLGVALNWMTYADADEQMYGNFIFVTNGGATVSPWEDERKTKFYQPGTVHDQKTIRIDQLRIWAKQSIVSNVPYGEPARFTIYMCNDSPTPDKASPIFTLVAPDDMNQRGAKIFFGGNALNSTGYTVPLTPGVVVAKEIEVYAGKDFDYEDLGLSLLDSYDLSQKATVKISAHFVPSAGNITISTPGDKWVVNTESPYDQNVRSYYMPVRIDGFNVNQRNFDHIELQYKLSTQGDKDWVNICSYYKSDSLMALANGTCKLIENDGYILASFFGEKDPVEQYYDLRAVVYCRNGNGFLTASSPILTGVKDTRRPQPFGTPKPVNGILGIGDDINITFSEPIASNYLSTVNNFEVLGMTNSTNITQGTCLRFNGGIGAGTAAERNLAGKSFTIDVMINPDSHTKPMGVFRHGTLRKNIQGGLAADNRLMVIMTDTILYSDQPVKFYGLHEVCYAFKVDMDNKKTYITFFDEVKKIGTAVYNGIYDGSSTLTLGCSMICESADGAIESDFYSGTMIELRVWNKAITEADIQQYGQKRLTGYEVGLLDNYYLNEGKGDVSYNKAVGGADLMLYTTSWNVPAGLSMKLDGEKGVVLKDSAFVRTAVQDYTLMFWFRADRERVNDSLHGTLLSNGPALNEPQWKNHFNIGLDDNKLYYRSGKFEVKAGDMSLNDGAWHHVAVTVNRSRNVGNLYIDHMLMQTFSVDTLGGIMGGTLAAGITYDDAYTTSNPLKGNIDEIALYEMTLPVNVIKDYATSTPSGREMGTLVYLPFSRSEKQKNNEQRLVPSGESIKQSRDNQGNYSSRMDVIIAPDVIARVSDRENYAPIDNTGQRENLRYSYVADKQNLLINIDEPAMNIEKTHVYVTVRDVADLNGNLMENPVMMDLYIYRNPLRWKEKRMNVEVEYGMGETVSVTIQNLSGKAHTYYLQDLPLWITPSKSSGTIAAADEETITLTVSPFINIGDFDEKINLVTDDGLTEPLPIHIKVRGEKPDWAVSEALKKKNLAMNIVARVIIDGVVADDPNDIIGVFGNGHETLGVANLRVDNTANANEALAFITVYSMNTAPQPLHIEYMDVSHGRISVLQPLDGGDLTFKGDTIVGTTTNPLILVNSGEEIQMLHLKKGWNWLSFYVAPEKNTVSNLLNRATKWEVGDACEVLGTNGFYDISYKGIPDPLNPTRINYFWDNGNDSIEITSSLMYRFFSKNDKIAYISGYYVGDAIVVKQGWNRIAFNSRLNLPITTALADYTASASVGDIIKSQNEFSMLVEDAQQNNRIWKGTLTHLTSGQGYMLKHIGQNEVVFNYPYYYKETRYGGVVKQAPLHHNSTPTSMNIIACAKGIDLQPGDHLVVYNGAELCGKAALTDDGLFFLSVADSKGSALSFAIERDDQLIAVTGDLMTYKADAVIGTVSEPTPINFATIDRYADGQWYDMQGRKLPRRPQRKGVYIYNGQKTIIE